MVTKEILDYIKAQLNEGVSRDEISNILKKQGGWSDGDIQEAFNKIDSGASENNQGEQSAGSGTRAGAIGTGQQKSSGLMTTVLIIAVLLLVGGGGTFAYFNYYQTPESGKISFSDGSSENEETQSNDTVKNDTSKKGRITEQPDSKWNIYTSSKCGFKIEYPSDWEPRPYIQEEDVTTGMCKVTFYNNTFSAANTGHRGFISISVYDFGAKEGVEVALNKLSEEKVDKKDKEIGGQTYEVYEHKGNLTSNVFLRKESTELWRFALNLAFTHDKEKIAKRRKEKEKIFNHMLSSIEFISDK